MSTEIHPQSSLTPEKLANLRAASKMGLTLRQTARQMGEFPTTVRRWCERYDIYLPPHKQTVTGKKQERYSEEYMQEAIENAPSWDAAANILGMHKSALFKWRDRHPHRREIRPKRAKALRNVTPKVRDPDALEEQLNNRKTRDGWITISPGV